MASSLIQPCQNQYQFRLCEKAGIVHLPSLRNSTQISPPRSMTCAVTSGLVWCIALSHPCLVYVFVIVAIHLDTLMRTGTLDWTNVTVIFLIGR